MRQSTGKPIRPGRWTFPRFVFEADTTLPLRPGDFLSPLLWFILGRTGVKKQGLVQGAREKTQRAHAPFALHRFHVVNFL
jgi:hypothetical protein